jgi:4-amino-4-deoxy-L-arabinose transferase-like glycosyltransferase
MNAEPRLARTLAIVAALVWLSCAAIRWHSAAPLGHDEARYALAGRDLLHGDDARWNYVPPGMEYIAVPGWLAGGSEVAFRTLPVLLSCLFFAAVWWIARRVGTAMSAAVAIGCLAANGALQRFSSDLLSDLPSAMGVALLAYVVYAELDREAGPSWRLVWAGPLAAIAIYVRYGSCIYIALIAVIAVAIFRGAVVRRPPIVLATIGAFLVVMAPHLINATLLYGRPWGTLMLSSTVPPGSGPGVAKYFSQPFAMLGVPTVVLIPFAIWYGLRSRLARALLCTAVLGIVALAIETLAQPRYVYVSVVLITILGAAGLDALLTDQRRRIAVTIVLALAGVLQIVAATRYRTTRVDGMQTTTAAARAIHSSRGTASCFVLGRHQTQLEWYSGCTAVLWPLDPRLPGHLVFAVRDNTGGPDQPDPGMVAALPGRHSVVLHVDGVVDVQRIDP